MPVRVDRPGRRRQVPAVDRRAAGRVGDRQPVAEQLRDAASGTGSRRTRRTRRRTRTAAPGTACRARCRSRPASGRWAGSCSKNAMFSRSAGISGSIASRLIALCTGSPRRRDRAGLDAQPAARAVLDVDLQRVARLRKPGRVERRRPEAVRRAAPASTRSYCRERITLCGQTKLQLPHWMHSSGSQDGHDLRDVALLVLRRAARIGAVHRQRADRQLVAAAGHHRRGHGAHELRRVRGHDRRRLAHGRHLRRAARRAWSRSSARSTAAWLRSTTSAPRWP